MITTACPSATPSPSPHTRHHNPHRCMHSTKEAYVSAWLHHQNLHDQAVEHLHLQHHYYPQYQNQHRPQQHYQHHHQYQQQQQHYSQQHHSPNGTEPNSHNQSPFQPAYSRINLRHRRSISLLKLAEIKDEIRRSQSQSQPQQQQHQEQKQNQGPQKRHSSVHASSNSKSYGSNHSNSSSATVINTAALANASKTTTTSAKPLPPTSQKHRRQMSLYTFNSPEPQHHQQRRSAEELAWDRHYYYQRQQLEEQVYFEQQNRVANLQGHHSGPIIVPSSSNAKLTSESPESAVARAKSLNRLACPAVLSRETSRALGICRSDTLSTNGGGNGIAPSRLRDHLTTGTTKEASSTNSRPVSPLPMHRNRSATFDTNWDHQYRGAPSTPPPSALKHRKTLKEHLAPSLRSLASRLGGGCGNSSNRPSSYAGSRGDLGIFDNNLSSRSATPTAGSSSSHRHSISGHMTDFKPLKVGPETVEHMRRCSVEQQQTPASMDGTTLERKTSHRRVVSLSGHHGGASGSNHSSPRNSLRLANGISGMTPSRSLHLFDDRAMDNQDDDAVEDGDEDEEEEDFIGDNAGRPRCTVLSEDPQSSSGNINNNGNDSMKKQILTILSLRRKSKSSLKSNSTSTTMMATSPMCLSPLELEAQESMPWEEDEEDEGEDEDDMDDADEVKEFEKEPEVGEEERDKDEPEPAVDFLLVPKAQYEFQPLVV
ncbi:hypothetical protein BGZ83_007831 [Gryganskiella cystojenkinii]|nr:hypothetical protein BGZ83_007831 [Gryganskiella cystojenkinii]